MAVEMKWAIAGLEYKNDADKGVVVAKWSCTAFDAVVNEFGITVPGTKSAFAGGEIKFEPDPSAEGYVDFDALTEETVLGWVKSALNETEETVEVIEAHLTGKVEKQLSPEIVSAVPDGFYPAEELAA
jgi:hypothetical protein